jgi:hypothetical protein
MFDSKYIKASTLADLKASGRLPMRVTISHVTQENIGSDDEQKKTKPVVYFVGKEKGMVLNRTNADRLTDIAGSDDTDNWCDLIVGLTIEKDRYKNDLIDCLRIVRWRGAGQPVRAQAAPARAAVPAQATRAAREHQPFDDDEAEHAPAPARNDDIPF